MTKGSWILIRKPSVQVKEIYIEIGRSGWSPRLKVPLEALNGCPSWGIKLMCQPWPNQGIHDCPEIDSNGRWGFRSKPFLARPLQWSLEHWSSDQNKNRNEMRDESQTSEFYDRVGNFIWAHRKTKYRRFFLQLIVYWSKLVLKTVLKLTGEKTAGNQANQLRCPVVVEYTNCEADRIRAFASWVQKGRFLKVELWSGQSHGFVCVVLSPVYRGGYLGIKPIGSGTRTCDCLCDLLGECKGGGWPGVSTPCANEAHNPFRLWWPFSAFFVF